MEPSSIFPGILDRGFHLSDLIGPVRSRSDQGENGGFDSMGLFLEAYQRSLLKLQRMH